jgi:hypothetical protein
MLRAAQQLHRNCGHSKRRQDACPTTACCGPYPTQHCCPATLQSQKGPKCMWCNGGDKIPAAGCSLLLHPPHRNGHAVG